MATSSPDIRTTPTSAEESEQFVRNIYHHSNKSAEIQQATDSHFLPNADQILTLPETTHFTNKLPSGSVVSWALAQKCYPLLRYLIHNGWDINREYNGPMGSLSLLGSPTVLRDINLVHFLLSHGANPRIGKTPPAPPLLNPVDNSKGWLLHLASIYSTLDTFLLLQSHGANLSYAHALHGAAYGGASQIPIIRHLLDSKAMDVDELDVYLIPHQGTALQVAIRKVHVEVVRVLVGYGAHPLACIKSPYEMSAVELARQVGRMDEGGSREILRMLEEARAVREREGRLGGVPVTGGRRSDRFDASVTSAESATFGRSDAPEEI